MSVKHTPGPWEAGDTFVCSAQGHLIADCIDEINFGPPLDQDTITENAGLIAAAPDMLAALKAIDSGECQGNSEGDLFVPSHIVDLFRQAIAKAEGLVP